MLTSKERVRLAINHHQPDYVPAGMYCIPDTWKKLMKKYNTSDINVIQEHFLIDIREVDPPYIGPTLKTHVNRFGETEYQAPFGYWYKNVWNGVEYNSIVTQYPLDKYNTLEELKHYCWPNPAHFDYESLKRSCAQYHNKAIMVGWPGPYQVLTFLRSAEKFYIDMALEPDFTKKMLNHYMNFVLEYYERMFIAADGQIDILRTCDDYGTQCSMLFSIDMWCDYFKESTRKLANLAHKYNAYFMQHSCGAVRPIIPELIRCGVDILDPMQKVVGMEPEGLKKDFGNSITFHVGIDTQHILPLGTPQAVTAESLHFIDILNQQGGYIFAPSQSLEGDVPIENIEAMYQARKNIIEI
ncbi:MAG: uroporphyrinogen decarboxylase family protein [Cellulosilyticaceae bacterium]